MIPARKYSFSTGSTWEAGSCSSLQRARSFWRCNGVATSYHGFQLKSLACSSCQEFCYVCSYFWNGRWVMMLRYHLRYSDSGQSHLEQCICSSSRCPTSQYVNCNESVSTLTSTVRYIHSSVLSSSKSVQCAAKWHRNTITCFNTNSCGCCGRRLGFKVWTLCEYFNHSVFWRLIQGRRHSSLEGHA